MRDFVQNRPVLFTALTLLALESIVLAGLLIARLADVPLIALDLPMMAVNALFAVVLLTALGWWRATGFNAPAQWRELHLLLLPLALILVPALALINQFPAPAQIAGLIVITLLIGFQEEAIFRGILLETLRPRGVLFAVLTSALLFGLIHANSLLVGRDPLFVIAQIVASFLGAIGIGALRVRLNTIWPLILLHAINDFVQFTATGGLEAGEVALYIPLAKIAIASVMAIYGLYLLRDQWPGRVRHVTGQSVSV